MAFNIDRFTSNIGLGEGLQSPAKFNVRIFLPSGIDTQMLEFMCEATNVPGLNIGSSPVRPLGYGNQFEAPLIPIYGDVTLMVRLDNAGNMSKLFSAWQKKVLNYDYAPGEGSNDAAAFTVSYLAEYSGVVEITTFAIDGTQTRKITLHDAWPKNIGEIQLAWADKDRFSVMPVNITYKTWTTSDNRS